MRPEPDGGGTHEQIRIMVHWEPQMDRQQAEDAARIQSAAHSQVPRRPDAPTHMGGEPPAALADHEAGAREDVQPRPLLCSSGPAPAHKSRVAVAPLASMAPADLDQLRELTEGARGLGPGGRTRRERDHYGADGDPVSHQLTSLPSDPAAARMPAGHLDWKCVRPAGNGSRPWEVSRPGRGERAGGQQIEEADGGGLAAEDGAGCRRAGVDGGRRLRRAAATKAVR